MTADKAVVGIGDAITFTATTDPAGYESWVAWSGGGDPATGEGATFSTSWANAGEYTVTASCGTSSKSTNVIVVKLETMTDATIPSDRTRRKLGVGEKVTLTLVGATEWVTWSLSGDGTLIVRSMDESEFTAHERASSASVTATYKSKLLNLINR